jgi:hypothetical protein
MLFEDWEEKENAMAIEGNRNVIPTYDEFYYEKLACEEEIYLEGTKRRATFRIDLEYATGQWHTTRR